MVGPLVTSDANWQRRPAGCAIACHFCGREVKPSPNGMTWIMLTGDDHATDNRDEAETLQFVGKDCARKRPELQKYVGTGAPPSLKF